VCLPEAPVVKSEPATQELVYIRHLCVTYDIWAFSQGCANHRSPAPSPPLRRAFWGSNTLNASPHLTNCSFKNVFFKNLASPASFLYSYLVSLDSFVLCLCGVTVCAQSRSVVGRVYTTVPEWYGVIYFKSCTEKVKTQTTLPTLSSSNLFFWRCRDIVNFS